MPKFSRPDVDKELPSSLLTLFLIPRDNTSINNRQGNSPRGLPKFTEAMFLVARNGAPESEAILLAKTIRACNLRTQGDFKLAEDVNREVYAIRLRINRSDHVNRAVIMNNLALDLKGVGKSDENARETQTCMSNAANSFHEKGRYQESARLLERVLELRRNTMGRLHHETIRRMFLLGADYRELDQIDRAVELQE
ncbi:hypothetical protein BBP40_006904 [Aspergillus hancockii]|nr:hypothetical protein BBP40_006904 [Aspergillus hancockii]